MFRKKVCGLGEYILLLEDLEMIGAVWKSEKIPVYVDEVTKETYYDVIAVEYDIPKRFHISHSEEECRMFQEALSRLGFEPRTNYYTKYRNPVTNKVHENVYVIEYGNLRKTNKDELVPIVFED